MKTDILLVGVAIVVMAVSVLSAGFTYYSITTFKENWVTGYVTEGVANITVTPLASVLSVRLGRAANAARRSLAICRAPALPRPRRCSYLRLFPLR